MHCQFNTGSKVKLNKCTCRQTLLTTLIMYRNFNLDSDPDMGDRGVFAICPMSNRHVAFVSQQWACEVFSRQRVKLHHGCITKATQLSEMHMWYRNFCFACLCSFGCAVSLCSVPLGVIWVIYLIKMWAWRTFSAKQHRYVWSVSKTVWTSEGQKNQKLLNKKWINKI